MSDKITQCPDCETAFRVTQDQLEAADGLVRCGTCQGVFNAPDHWNKTDYDEIILEGASDEELSEGYINEILVGTEANAPLSPVAIDYQLDDSLNQLPVYNEHSLQAEPQDWLLSKENLQLNQENTISSPDSASAEQEDAGNADSWNYLSDTFTEDTPLFSTQVEEPFENEEPSENEQLLANIESPPVEMLWEIPAGTKTISEKQGKWYGAAAIAALLLVCQFGWVNFDKLAVKEQYRPIYAAICDLAKCELPVRIDISKIHNNNLIVRSHPEYTDALQVDTIITNQATYSQPFPVLKLAFSNLNGQAVAAREFTPDEYLSGDLKGVTMMPVRQSIHVSLEILHPGSEAVNYTMTFRSSDDQQPN